MSAAFLTRPKSAAGRCIFRLVTASFRRTLATQSYMYSDDDIQFALQSTEILHEPDRRIDTFGTTAFVFHLVSELMDDVNKVRVRTGKITAERPLVLKPEISDNMELEGFSEQASALFEWLKKRLSRINILRYGFTLKKSDVTEELITDSLANVSARVVKSVRDSGSPMTVVLQGVDDAWDVSLVKFHADMIAKSFEINRFDWKRRGLLD